MLWSKIKILTNSKATDIVASVLFDNGIIGAEIEDSQNLTSDELKKMYVDIPKIVTDNGLAYVIFYVAKNDEKSLKEVKKNLLNNGNVDISYFRNNDNIFTNDEFDKIMTNIKNELNEYRNFIDMGELTISEEIIDDNIFLNKWKNNFKRLIIGNICVIPNFDTDKINDKYTNIYIEPGNAFGTGKHETTKLCIEFLNEINIENNFQYMLDIGCGSGILGIVGTKLGVKNVFLIDVDENIECNLINNLKLNNINDYCKKLYIYHCKIDKNSICNSKIVYGFGNLIDDIEFRKKISKYYFDIITINILAPIIIKHLVDVKISNFLNKNGYMILSGILVNQVDNIIRYIKNDKTLNVENIKNDGEWACILVKKIGE